MATKSFSKVEDAIQREYILWLKREFPQARVTATRNEDSRYRGDELELGVTDLIIRWKKGEIRQLFYLELKRLKGTLSPSEKKWAAEFEPCENESYAVAYGLEEAKEVTKLTLKPSQQVAL